MLKGIDLVQQLLVAADQGRNWMQTQGTDLLVWGEIIYGGAKKIQIIRNNLHRVKRLL